MNILVSGGRGFVGKALVELLNKQGHNALAFDLPENDITNFLNVDAEVRQSDLVVHCAAMADLNEVAANRFKGLDVNVYGTMNFVEACRAHKKPLVYISTACVYGDQSGRFTTEETEPLPVELYARTKYMGEFLIKELDGYAPYCILRLGTVYGPGMRPALFNYKIFSKALRGETVQIYGDGSASRNYIYIDDLVDGIARAVDFVSKKDARAVFNLVGDEITDLNEVRKVAAKIHGDFEFEHTEPRDLGDYPEDICNKRAKVVLDWEPKTKYFDGMVKTYEFVKQDLKAKV